MWSELTVDFDASEWFFPRAGFSPENELEASTESGWGPTSALLGSHCFLASRDLNMSINESDFTSSPATGDWLSLKASAKHSLAISIPSASTPGPGSTIPHEPN